MPEDGARPPPWLVPSTHQTEYIQPAETKVHSFFDDEEIEAPKQWLPAHHLQQQQAASPSITIKGNNSNKQTASAAGDFWPGGGVTQQPTSSKRVQPSVKEPSGPAGKLPAASQHTSSKPSAEVYHARNPVKPPQKAAAARPNYYDSSEYYDYYEFEGPEKNDEISSFFDEPTTKLPSPYRSSSSSTKRPKAAANSGFVDLTQPTFRPPASNFKNDDPRDSFYYTTEKQAPEERQRPVESSRSKNPKKPIKEEHRTTTTERIRSEFEDDDRYSGPYQPYPSEHHVFSGKKGTTTEEPTTTRRNSKPKSTTTFKLGKPVIREREKSNKNSYFGHQEQQQWTEGPYEEDHWNAHAEPSQFKFRLPDAVLETSQQDDGDGPLEVNYKNEFKLKEKESHQPGRRPASPRLPPLIPDFSSVEDDQPEGPDPFKTTSTQRPPRPSKRPPVTPAVYQRPTEPVDFLDGLKALKVLCNIYFYSF